MIKKKALRCRKLYGLLYIIYLDCTLQCFRKNFITCASHYFYLCSCTLSSLCRSLYFVECAAGADQLISKVDAKRDHVRHHSRRLP